MHVMTMQQIQAINHLHLHVKTISENSNIIPDPLSIM